MGVARPEGPQPEARRAESGGGVLGEGAASPSPLDRGPGERCELPQRGHFGAFWDLRNHARTIRRLNGTALF